MEATVTPFLLKAHGTKRATNSVQHNQFQVNYCELLHRLRDLPSQV